MIKDIERGKSDIFGALKDVRQDPKKRAHELVELLEDKRALDKLLGHQEISKEIKAEHNRRHNFYRAYIVYVFNHFIFDDDDVEIMLVAFNYHPDFAHETKAKYRRDLFARQVYELKHSTGWGDTIEAKDRGLRDEEARIMEELSEILAALAAKQGGTLDLVEEVLATLEPPDIVEDAVGNGDSTSSAEGSRQDTLEDRPPAEEPRADAPPDEEIPSNEPDTPLPQPARVHISHDSHDLHDSHNIINYMPVTIRSRFHVNIRQHWWIIPIFLVAIGFACIKFFAPPPPVTEIFVTEEEIMLAPGGECPLKVAVLPVKAMDAPLSFVSADPATVSVSHTGVLSAHDNPQGEPYQEVDITIQAESGVTKTKTVTVDFSGGNSNPSEASKEVTAGYYVWQKIRLAGTTEWFDGVDAEIGDVVEIQIQYKNISEATQKDVMIRDVLPDNLDYIPGTTKLYNVKYDGGILSEGINTTGVNIGNYTSGSNAYVRFSAKVVDMNLAPGSNTLVNWSQAGVGPVTLNDYTTVVLQKAE